ncbi:hypothetical protein SCUCBS95973_004041 [Sporothrix curviconia]|uniref:FAD-binding PCMH-type domain-containing protein n=1 Tax=Sporothrix curviconia TaxID=1260050 RepID=A0ABP0BKQ8_9PEZI
MGAQQSVERRLRHARSQPYNDNTLKQLDKVFCQNPDNAHDGVWNVVRTPGMERRRGGRDSRQRYSQARQSVHLALAASHGHLVGSSDAKNGPRDYSANDDEDSPSWVNCVGEQENSPLVIVKPESLQQLVAILADALHLKQRVRAVGSGHSFSDITSSTNAVLVDMSLLKRIAMVDNGEDGIAGITKPLPGQISTASHLTMEDRPSSSQTVEVTANRSRKLARVQAGMKIHELNDELDNRGLALLNMGAYDGQTIAGVMSTGTHGSGITFGPMASLVRAIVLVADDGTVYQVEPATQSDEVRKQLLPELWAPIAPAVAGAEHFELVINPYMLWAHNSCIRVERNRVTPKTKPSGARKDWLSTLLEQFGIYSIPHLLGVLKRFPAINPIVINRAITTLVESGPYVDKSFRVFNLGPANSIKAMAIELHCDATQASRYPFHWGI